MADASAEHNPFRQAHIDEEIPAELPAAGARFSMEKKLEHGPKDEGAQTQSCRIMSAAAEASPFEEETPSSDGLHPANRVRRALSEAQQESRRLQRRVRLPALLLGFLLMGISLLPAQTAWTSQAAMVIFVRDLLRLLGRMCWLCACLPSDRWAPKLGSILLLIMGGRCLFFHFKSSALYCGQLADFFETGSPCELEGKEADCALGAFMIFSKALMFTIMHSWQFPYLICGLFLPSRVCLARLWVGLAMVQLTKGLTDFLTVLPAMAVRVQLGSPVPSDVVLYTSLHGISSLVSGLLLMHIGFRRWVYFRILSAGGAFTAASSVAAFLGTQTSRKVMELAQDTCRFIALNKVTEKDLMKCDPDPALKKLSSPCQLQDIDAFLSHSWHDPSGAKWEALQAWRKSFKAQNQREPRLWIDKYCIDQDNIEDCLMCLPVFLACCHTLLIIAGETYFDRLWCVEEVFVYLMMDRSLNSIELLPICSDIQERIATFDSEAAQCHEDKDRQKLLATIEAGCGDYETFNEQVRTALIHALRKSPWGAATVV